MIAPQVDPGAMPLLAALSVTGHARWGVLLACTAAVLVAGVSRAAQLRGLQWSAIVDLPGPPPGSCGPAPDGRTGRARRPCGHDAGSADPCFDCFYGAHSSRFVHWAARLCAVHGVGDEARDVLQQALTELVERWSPAIEHPCAYLYQSIRNEAYNAAHHRGVHKGRHRASDVSLDATALDCIDRGPSPESEALGAELRRLLHGAVEALPPVAGNVAYCRYLLELSPAETAEHLGMSETAVNSALDRATKGLRRLLPPDLLDNGDDFENGRHDVGGGDEE